jgi:hypothetical protein
LRALADRLIWLAGDDVAMDAAGWVGEMTVCRVKGGQGERRGLGVGGPFAARGLITR